MNKNSKISESSQIRELLHDLDSFYNEAIDLDLIKHTTPFSQYLPPHHIMDMDVFYDQGAAKYINSIIKKIPFHLITYVNEMDDEIYLFENSKAEIISHLKNSIDDLKSLTSKQLEEEYKEDLIDDLKYKKHQLKQLSSEIVKLEKDLNKYEKSQTKNFKK